MPMNFNSKIEIKFECWKRYLNQSDNCRENVT